MAASGALILKKRNRLFAGPILSCFSSLEFLRLIRILFYGRTSDRLYVYLTNQEKKTADKKQCYSMRLPFCHAPVACLCNHPANPISSNVRKSMTLPATPLNV